MLFAGYMRGRGRLVNNSGTSQIGRRRMELQGFQFLELDTRPKVMGRWHEKYNSKVNQDGGMLICDDGPE